MDTSELWFEGEGKGLFPLIGLSTGLDGEHEEMAAGLAIEPESASDSFPALVLRVADVVAEPVEWLWLGWIPLGKLTVLDGDPGLGKSTALLDLAAQVSAGSTLPDGSAAEGAGDVLAFLLRMGSRTRSGRGWRRQAQISLASTSSHPSARARVHGRRNFPLISQSSRGSPVRSPGR